MNLQQADKHAITTESTVFGWKAKCSCGKFSLGFFPSGERAKKAMMNCNHPEQKGTK